MTDPDYIVCDLKICELCGVNFTRESGDQSAVCPRCQPNASAILPSKDNLQRQRLALHSELVHRLRTCDSIGPYEQALAQQLEQIDQRLKIAVESFLSQGISKRNLRSVPIRPRRPCTEPGCDELSDCGLCAAHRRERDRRRASSSERGYDRRWQQAASGYFARHPVCESDRGCTRPATVRHHIRRLVDGGAKYDERNLQPLCDECHNKLGGRGGRG